ncbi:MAG: DciA family protein [Pseudomonadota bacterium]|nr:DciA family protein [Pseudomonadota bacterium]
MRPLSTAVHQITRKALGKTGSHLATLLSHWADIVGPALAGDCSPEKLSFPRGSLEGAVLHLRVSGSAALVLQHDESLILERINRVFGYRAVERLKYVQGPPVLPAPVRSRAPSLPDAARTARVEKLVADVDDSTLREALKDLGCAVRS